MNTFAEIRMTTLFAPVSFTMELEDNGKLTFLGMVIISNGPRLDTKVYKKPTDTGLLLHYQSHVDACEVEKFSTENNVKPGVSTLFDLEFFSIRNVNVLKGFLLAYFILKPS